MSGKSTCDEIEFAKQLLLVRRNLARLREKDACRPATDIFDAVCVSCAMIGQLSCSRDNVSTPMEASITRQSGARTCDGPRSDMGPSGLPNVAGWVGERYTASNVAQHAEQARCW